MFCNEAAGCIVLPLPVLALPGKRVLVNEMVRVLMILGSSTGIQLRYNDNVLPDLYHPKIVTRGIVLDSEMVQDLGPIVTPVQNETIWTPQNTTMAEFEIFFESQADPAFDFL